MGPLLPWKLHFFGLENPSSYQGNQSSKKKNPTCLSIRWSCYNCSLVWKHATLKKWGDESRVMLSYLWWEPRGGQSLRRWWSKTWHQVVISFGVVRHWRSLQSEKAVHTHMLQSGGAAVLLYLPIWSRALSILKTEGQYLSKGGTEQFIGRGSYQIKSWICLCESATLTSRMYGYTATFWLKIYHMQYKLLTKCKWTKIFCFSYLHCKTFVAGYTQIWVLS